MKFLFFRRMLRKENEAVSWLDVTVWMVLVANGFGLLETLVYLITSDRIYL